MIKSTRLMCGYAIAGLLTASGYASIAQIKTKSEVAPQPISIDIQKKGASISASMYGVFFEEINHAGDGGLYAELVQNRSFEDGTIPDGFSVNGNKLIAPPFKDHLTGEVNPIQDKLRWNTEPVRGWTLESKNSGASMRITQERPHFQSAPSNLEVTIPDGNQEVAVVNNGFWGMGVEGGSNYDLRTIIRVSPDYKGAVRACLISENGKILASCALDISRKDEWTDIRKTLKPTDKDAKAKLSIIFNAPGKVWLDYVSLFPESTFNNRPNGLRKDIAQTIADLKPTFMRWPGGTVVGGITLNTRFEWKKTLGDPASRPGQLFTWGYRCSYGLGYYEMLQYCEDMKANAMYVCNVGLGDQFRTGEASPENEINFYINDCLDAIEYALGAPNTTWGARRVADGHPGPFPLKYVEVGNEHWGKEYDRRFSMFYKEIKKHYPQITVIYDGMNFRPEKGAEIQTDMVDLHSYDSVEGFYRSNDRFDNYQRGNYKIYIGEYACNSGVGSGNLSAALSEASFIGGMERNGDLVTMTSYAPLLQNENDRRWPVNLIWFNSEKVIGRSSYYVQKMAVDNRPTYNVWNSFNHSKTFPVTIKAGKIGFGSLASRVEFKDIKIVEKGKPAQTGILPADITNGEWKITDGVLAQTSLDKRSKYLLKNISSNDFTLECKARRFKAREGFLIYFGADEQGNGGYVANIGGGIIPGTVIEQVDNSLPVSNRVPQTLENGRWYSVKLVVTSEESKLYVDGILLNTHHQESTPQQFLSSGYDKNTGELVLKFVNSTSAPFATAIDLKGATYIENAGKVISLSSGSPKDENTFDQPRRIYPVESVFNGFGNNFNYQFPPFSYTILRIKAN